MNLSEISKDIKTSFLEGFDHNAVPDDEYTDFSYPKLIKLMRFHTDRFIVNDFGHLFLMHTKTAFGMELLTCSFMPNTGKGVPYLLIDTMTVGKKRCVFVEYYDMTADLNDQSELIEVGEKYKDLSDYTEKPAWYIDKRQRYSLIKGGTAADDDVFRNMMIDSVNAYHKAVMKAEVKADNLLGLESFRERMIRDGNPSSSVLNKVFGEKGAEEFFCKCVMPMKEEL